MYVFRYVFMYTSIYFCTYRCVCVCVHIQTCICIGTYIYIYVHTQEINFRDPLGYSEPQGLRLLAAIYHCQLLEFSACKIDNISRCWNDPQRRGISYPTNTSLWRGKHVPGIPAEQDNRFRLGLGHDYLPLPEIS